MRFLSKALIISVESYATDTYNLVIGPAVVDFDYTRVNPTLEEAKRFFSTDHSAVLDFKVVKDRESRDVAEWHYAYDRKTYFEECRVNEKFLRTFLTDEEFTTLFNDGILEPYQCYLEAHQISDGYWHSCDYYTRVQVL